MENIYEFANYQAAMQAEMAKIRLWKDNALLFSINGGTFEIDTTLISFVCNMVSRGRSNIILEDRNNNPIKIDDILEFQRSIQDIYFSVMNGFYMKMDKLKSSRTVKALVNK